MSETPFKPLEEFTERGPGGFTIIEQARDNPDLLVKEVVNIIWDKDHEGDAIFYDDYTFDVFQQEIVEPIRFLQERGFKKFIPEVQPVWGKDNNGKERGYLVTKRVRGLDLESAANLEPQVVEELDEFIAKSLMIITETLVSHTDVVSPDILQLTENGPTLHNIIIGLRK